MSADGRQPMSAKRAQGKREEGAQRGAAMAEYLPEDLNDSDAKEKLLGECESIWLQMEECQNKIRLLQRGTQLKSDAKLSLLMMQVKAYTAEYHEWQKRSPEPTQEPNSLPDPEKYKPLRQMVALTFVRHYRPKVISANPDVCLTVGKEELQKVKNELEKVLSALQIKNKQVDEDLRREQQWYEEQEQIAAALERMEEEEKTQTEELSQKSASIFDELQDKRSKLKTFKEELLNALGKFLADYFPLPERSGSANRNYSEEPAIELITLHEILEILVRQTLKTPHEPYVAISDSFWPPYIELLLRYGIALRHPEDPNRIRLEAFHM